MAIGAAGSIVLCALVLLWRYRTVSTKLRAIAQRQPMRDVLLQEARQDVGSQADATAELATDEHLTSPNGGPVEVDVDLRGYNSARLPLAMASTQAVAPAQALSGLGVEQELESWDVMYVEEE